MTLGFYAMHLIIGEKSPDYVDLQSVFGQVDDSFESNGTYYLVSTKITCDNYFWFSARYGNPYPHSETLWDIENKSESENPRTITQIEPNKQLFALYSLDKKTLYLSNIKKKSLFEGYLKSK